MLLQKGICQRIFERIYIELNSHVFEKADGVCMASAWRPHGACMVLAENVFIGHVRDT
jgi:hypothetical protein